MIEHSFSPGAAPTDPDYGAEALAAREALARLGDFQVRAQGGVAFTNYGLFEEFCNDLIEQARQKLVSKSTATPQVAWSANEQLAAVKYAADQGFVTALEAQRLVRKLLKLKGRRTLAVVRPRARRTTPTRRTTR